MKQSHLSSAFNSFKNKNAELVSQSDTKHSNLFVYGYASNLYRDDDRASELEQGKHLIPWMGNDDLKIDRYDVRGCLTDLSQFEGEFNIILTDEEQNIEKMCEIERYHALLSNVEEEESYQEEEMKRHNQSLAKEYHQVPFKYDSLSSMEVNETCAESIVIKYCDSLKNDLTLNSNLLNIDFPLATNMKEIIDKTAKCVAKHGRQMEIIIKTRQANNDKFNFLNCHSQFNSYYECVLNEFKKRENQIVDKRTNDHDTNIEFKLSNFVEAAPQTSPTSDDLKFKTSVLQDCPYNMLVNNIQNTQNKFNQFNLDAESVLYKVREYVY